MTETKMVLLSYDCEEGVTYLCLKCKAATTAQGRGKFCPNCGRRITEHRSDTPKKANKRRAREVLGEWRRRSMGRGRGWEIVEQCRWEAEDWSETRHPLFTDDLKQAARCLAIHRRLKLKGFLSDWKELKDVNISQPREELLAGLDPLLRDDIEEAISIGWVGKVVWSARRSG